MKPDMRTAEERAREFCEGAFTPFGVQSIEPYVQIIKELIETESPQWFPIETAPKDGATVWVAERGHMRLAFWKPGAEYEHRGSVGGGWRDFAHALCLGRGGLCDLQFSPTHWMPLPEPPK